MNERRFEAQFLEFKSELATNSAMPLGYSLLEFSNIYYYSCLREWDQIFEYLEISSHQIQKNIDVF
jgi:hypothetical protein